MTDEAIQSHYGHRSVMATVVRGGETKEYKLKDLAPAEKLEKFVEDVRFGIYPITNFGLLYRQVEGSGNKKETNSRVITNSTISVG